MITDKLPDKPSAILRTALKDLTKIENNPISFEVRMDDWVITNAKSGKCEVCLAGAALIHTCGMGAKDLDWNDVSEELNGKLEFINLCRHGSIRFALSFLLPSNEDIPDDLPQFKVPDYSPVDKHQFRSKMNEIADMLESKGL
jgi:hypothetical protein